MTFPNANPGQILNIRDCVANSNIWTVLKRPECFREKFRGGNGSNLHLEPGFVPDFLLWSQPFLEQSGQSGPSLVRSLSNSRMEIRMEWFSFYRYCCHCWYQSLHYHHFLICLIHLQVHCYSINCHHLTLL